MDNILVVTKAGNVAGLANTGELNELAIGDLIAIGDGHVFIGADSTIDVLSAVKEVVFLVKTADKKFRRSVSIPREYITNFNIQEYSAPQNKIVRVGGITSVLRLEIDDSSFGEANVSIRNMSYDHTVSTQRINVSLLKRVSETGVAFVQRLVAEINKAMAKQALSFGTATFIQGVDPDDINTGFTFETANPHVDLAIALDGLLLGASVVTTQEAKVSFGKGEDVLAMEKNLSKHLGNSNYEQLTDLWYKEPFVANPATNYDMATLRWDGMAPTPTFRF